MKGDSTEITAPDIRAFLLDLFARHQNSGQKLGLARGDIRIFYGKNSAFKGKSTQCFYLEQADGTREDISYLKCIARIRDDVLTKRTETMKQAYEKQGIHIVELISKTLQTFLLSQPQIIQVLLERFPYKKLRLEQQYFYFRMVLELAAKCESAEEQLLGICFDKFIQIDADIDAQTHRAMIMTDAEAVDEKLSVCCCLAYLSP
jgi:hypothetical protein